jgi:hypothetical protein
MIMMAMVTMMIRSACPRSPGRTDGRRDTAAGSLTSSGRVLGVLSLAWAIKSLPTYCTVTVTVAEFVDALDVVQGGVPNPGTVAGQSEPFVVSPSSQTFSITV